MQVQRLGDFDWGGLATSLVPAASQSFISYNNAQAARDQSTAAQIYAAQQRASQINFGAMLPYLLIGGVLLIGFSVLRR